jgi:sulfate adenylyltransferase
MSSRQVLFVCTANVCRSAFLELYARARLGTPGVEFASAGTHAVDGQPMSPEMGDEARTHWGLDPTPFRSRALTDDVLDGAELVLTAETRHQQLILATHPDAADRVLTLGQAIRGAAVADPRDDVADPFGLGGQAQSVAARLMAVMLDTLPLPDLIHLTPARRPAHG